MLPEDARSAGNISRVTASPESATCLHRHGACEELERAGYFAAPARHHIGLLRNNVVAALERNDFFLLKLLLDMFQVRYYGKNFLAEMQGPFPARR